MINKFVLKQPKMARLEKIEIVGLVYFGKKEIIPVEKRESKLTNGKTLSEWKAPHTIQAIDEWPLTGACIRSRCACGVESLQPVHGSPKKYAHLKGTTYMAWCLSRKHA